MKRENEAIQFLVDEGEYKTYGIEECKRTLTAINGIKYVREPRINFDLRMAYLYMARIQVL